MDKRNVFVFAVGNMPLNPIKLMQTVNFIKLLDGFIGLHPCYPKGTLLVFDSLNNSKRARNILQDNGVQCGTYIMKATLTADNKNLLVEGVAE